jgi:small nuclear ribonucleoprotein (snRNP)-like protein
MNCILADAKEHIYSSSSEEGIKEVELGMYLIRGELIAAIGKFFNNRDLLDR